ncbi:N-6 DNA methylase [Burkholderia ambifaria]|uniref:N-6 DNA methylase n=1 Tax=Burkholderia ambifaria TaxID=152480 RepID=UPI001B9DEBA5|nr:N-6 DNA methylase [Burkholderia ambifaria]MBR8256689.1 N-6 DNA methylase [Burkholderia ambifaria]
MNFIENETKQKLRGGYYTPLDLAIFISKWVKEVNPKNILEPSCGDGVFFEALAKAKGFQRANVVGFELDSEEAQKSRARASDVGLKSIQVNSEDFLGWAIDHLHDGGAHFDAVIGNPPFVRYQYLPEPFQICAEQIFDKLALRFTKHTNAWVSFILAGMALLRPGGRLAMVVPAEIIHVTHAQSLRSYLGQECRRLVIIDPEELWFSDTLQGAVILLAEKRRSPTEKSEGLGMYPVKGREFLRLDPSSVFSAPQAINGKTVQGKWTRALLDSETRSLFDELAEHPDVHRFDAVANVDVGIVTGANKFFLVSDEVVRNYRLNKWAHPMFGRSEHCPGIIYDDRQHAVNAAKGNPTNFLWFRDDVEKIDAAAKAYIKIGEDEKLHTRYKCRIRSPWYTVPSVYATEIGMLKRSHDTPRLILNRIGAYTTDTAYRIRTHGGISAEKLVGCFVNPLTALSAELEGRHYGGGVLELIPSEIERLIVPLPVKIDIDLCVLDAAIRESTTHRVLANQGKAVLGALGMSHANQECVLEGWRKLRDRRHRTSSEPLENDG